MLRSRFAFASREPRGLHLLSSVLRNRRLLTIAMATTIVVVAGWAPSGVAAADPSAAPSSAPPVGSGDLVITPDQAALVNEKLSFISEKGLWGEFALDRKGTLTTVHSLAEIQAEFDLSDDQVTTMKAILDFAASAKNVKVPKDSRDISPMVFVNGSVIYFSFSEVGGLLLTAALAGPFALGAAITAVGAMLGGPVGAAIGVIMTFLGVATLSSLAYQIIQGYYYHQGMYFGIAWNGIFPVWTQGNWCGCS